MLLSKIHSKYLILDLFSFIKEKKMLKLSKNNSFLNKYLNLSEKEYKTFFFKKKIENYNFYYIKDYYPKFKSAFNSIIKNEEELNELILNCLSQNVNFELKISDENFNMILNNIYFQEKIRINFECLKENNSFKLLTKNEDKVLKNFFEKEIDDLKDLEDMEFKQIIDKNFLNLLKKSKEKNIFKLSMFMIIDKKYLKLLNINKIFDNIKKLDISISNLNKIIELKIKCYNVEELSLNIFEEDLKYNINELSSIFPNITILNIYIERKFDLFELMRNLNTFNINTLKIVIFKIDDEFNFEINSNIILEKIISLEIDIEEEYNINEFLFKFFNYIEIPFLKEYTLHFNLYQFMNNKLNSNNSDFNIINQFLIHVLNNKNEFLLQSFFNLPNQLNLIRYFHLNLNSFEYIFKKKKKEKYFFKFNINNQNQFQNYYPNFNLSIDKNEINKYRKIDIKGIENKINIKEIKEKNDINLCDINLNLNQEQYFIKSFKDLRSIYCKDIINKKTLLVINQIDNLSNLKYINLSIGKIKESDEDIINEIFYKLINKSENLKSLILRLDSYNFNKNVNFILQLIQNLEKLRIINISQNIINPIYDLELKEILNKFPKIKEKKLYFDEFIIGNEEFTSTQKLKKSIFNCNMECIYDYINLYNIKTTLLTDLNNEIKEKCIFFFNNKIINDIVCDISKKGKYKLKIIVTKPLINIDSMFLCCSSLISVNLSNFNSNNVTNMSCMFYGCSSLTSLNLSNFNSNNVIYMNDMFNGCSSLTSVNLSNFNTNNVNNMNHMFYGCSSLTSLNSNDKKILKEWKN